jgi:hypothetical protein
MNLCRKTPVYAVLFVCVLFFSCDKNDTAKKIKAADGVPVITEQPKSANYLEDDRPKELTIKASVKGEYTLSYQWYSMQRYMENHVENENPTEQQISIEVNKLINNNIKDSQFTKEMSDKPVCRVPRRGRGKELYICIVTSTSKYDSKTFKVLSDIAVITTIGHPLTYWHEVDKNEIYDRDLKNITYGNGCFVAIGSYNQSRRYDRIAYSNDGKTWNLVEGDTVFHDDKESIINAVAYGNGRFVAVGSKGKIAYSTDIKTWIPVESTVSKDFKDIVYGNGLFIANFVSGLLYSSNGETWFAVENFDKTWISCIAYGNGRFIAGDEEGRIVFSDNGKTWTTLKDDIFDSYAIRTITYGNGRFIAITYDNDYCGGEEDYYIIGYSNDGKTWDISSSIPSIDSGIERIFYSEGYFIIVGDCVIAYSKDGNSWNIGKSYSREWATGSSWNDVAYGDGYFVAVGNKGEIHYCQYPITKAIAPVIRNLILSRNGYIWVPVSWDIFGEYSFQWYRNNIDNTDTGIAIEGANHWSYTPDVSKDGITYYYVKVTNTILNYFNVDDENRSASVISNTFAVTVGPPEDTAVKLLGK